MLLPMDFGVEESQGIVDPKELFGGLVCCDALVEIFEEYRCIIEDCAAEGTDLLGLLPCCYLCDVDDSVDEHSVIILLDLTIEPQTTRVRN